MFNLMQTGEFSVNKNTKLRFVRPLINIKKVGGFVNIYDDIDSVNYDPFGEENFYNKIYNYRMKDDVTRFDDYIKNPQKKFSMTKYYNNVKFYIYGCILTLFFAMLALRKKPIEPISKIIDFLIPDYLKRK